MRIETAAKLACAYSGLVWGLFWLPIRALDSAGISGVWAVLGFYVIPFVLLAPVMVARGRTSLAGWWPNLLGFSSAIGLALYSLAVLNTEVVKAMLLFYLTPIWSTLIARIWLGEPITPMRWLAPMLGLLGMMVIFEVDRRFPWPERIGDWMALGSGIGWAITANLYRADGGRTAAIDLLNQNFLWSAIVALLVVIIAHPSTADAPSVATYVAQLWWLVPTIIFVVMSGVYATMWGAPKLNPGIVGLLFMTEISVGAITAAIWAGEPFGIREIIGIILITSAGVAEGIWELLRGPQASRASPSTSGTNRTGSKCSVS
jgi:drug/metabolite transporter (DMT)-like permease